MASELVASTRLGAVTTITLNRAEALNALTRELRSALRSELETALGDRSVRAVVLTGAGRAFSVGQDLQEMRRFQDAGEDMERLVTDEYMPIFRILRQSPKPIVAALNGPAVGGGMSLALACDIRLATAKATLVAGFVKVALSPDTGASFLLARSVGLAKALELCLTGDALSPEDAKSLGLVRAVLADPEAVLAAAQDLAASLASGPRLALQEIRQVLYHAAEAPWEAAVAAELAAQIRLGASTDHPEAVRAFLEKRPPRFE